MVCSDWLACRAVVFVCGHYTAVRESSPLECLGWGCSPQQTQADVQGLAGCASTPSGSPGGRGCLICGDQISWWFTWSLLRRYNSLHEEEEVTPEEMEAYRLRKARGEDPLAFMQASKEGTVGGGAGYDYV